ncbi:GvpL/GvpF family gas vesicle protein [Streptomyces sp. NPDC002018]|uniref:GvpL/GvpF family gas vesicle protein n=1 Tax=Streptomyces sp. NPDC002018 TaxID=3364629 RepID=UPI0036A1138A
MSTEAPSGAALSARRTGEAEHGPVMSYVYAVGRAGAALDSAVSHMTGLEGGALRTVGGEGTFGGEGMAALVSDVPSAAYDTEGMKTRMEDLRQLEALARSHHAVVEAAYASTTVLPMRLATVCRDDARVMSMLHTGHQEFSELLSRLEGRVELGVKVYADPEDTAVASPDPAPDPDRPPAPAGPGRAYLERRRAQRRSHQNAYRAAGALAARVPDLVAALACARVVHRPQQGVLASGTGENIANEAYLVPAAEVEEFRAALAGLERDTPGARVEITGPWAPYSFATPSPQDGPS